MKKINKIILGVVGGLTLFANKGQVTSASTNVQHYGTLAQARSTFNYSDNTVSILNNNIQPSAKPTPTSTLKPSSKPTPTYTSKPTATPTPKPTPKPTAKPTAKPSLKPTAKPTPKPTPKSTAKAGQGVTGIIKNFETSISNFFAGLFGK